MTHTGNPRFPLLIEIRQKEPHRPTQHLDIGDEERRWHRGMSVPVSIGERPTHYPNAGTGATACLLPKTRFTCFQHKCGIRGLGQSYRPIKDGVTARLQVADIPEKRLCRGVEGGLAQRSCRYVATAHLLRHTYNHADSLELGETNRRTESRLCRLDQTLNRCVCVGDWQILWVGVPHSSFIFFRGCNHSEEGWQLQTCMQAHKSNYRFSSRRFGRDREFNASTNLLDLYGVSQRNGEADVAGKKIEIN